MAAKFKFHLETLLEMRLLQEQRAQARLGEQLRVVEAEKAALVELEGVAAAYRDELAERQRGNLDIHAVMTYMSYLNSVDSRIRQQLERIAGAEQEAERLRGELLKATQQKKSVEKLRERHLEEFTKEQQRAETLFLDEMSSTRQKRSGTEPSGEATPPA